MEHSNPILMGNNSPQKFITIGEAGCNGKAAKPLRPSLALGHLPAERGGFSHGLCPHKRLPTMWGAGRACEA